MEEKIFTEKELGKYDGQNGNPAYVAIDGVVYDVTNVSRASRKQGWPELQRDHQKIAAWQKGFG